MSVKRLCKSVGIDFVLGACWHLQHFIYNYVSHLNHHKRGSSLIICEPFSLFNLIASTITSPAPGGMGLKRIDSGFPFIMNRIFVWIKDSSLTLACDFHSIMTRTLVLWRQYMYESNMSKSVSTFENTYIKSMYISGRFLSWFHLHEQILRVQFIGESHHEWPKHRYSRQPICYFISCILLWNWNTNKSI